MKPSMKPSILFAAVSAASLAACATGGHIEGQLKELGVSAQKADCVAGKLTDKLDRQDQKAVTSFLDDLIASNSPGNTLDALLRIENPRVAAVMTTASVTCAFSRGD